MIAQGFRPVAWVAAVGGAALSCYMLSLQVAAERGELAGIERRILIARQQIRTLETELDTRGRLQQLEHWNAEVLALSAPVAGQFLESNVSLARFDVRQRGFADAEVRMAAADRPAPAPAPAAPVRLASAPVEAPAPSAPEPLVRRASLTVERPAPTPAATPVRARTSPGLLDEATLRDLGAAARSEGREAARD